MKHKPYYDVTMPPGATAIIRENLEWSTPNSLVMKIQSSYPNITANQVHNSWTMMSKTLWKRDPNQIVSAKLLLEELSDDVVIFDVKPEEGVEQLCWGLKHILARLKDKVVEIGLDATCTYLFGCYETNILGEYDNASYPLSYCLLSTAEALPIRKRMHALDAWAKMLLEQYQIKPTFIHVDKDMAEIGMAKHVWPDAKIQLCWWHLRRAIKQRLAQNKLSMTPYNVMRAQKEFPFIDPKFVPKGCADPKEHEGGMADDSGQLFNSSTEHDNTNNDANVKVLESSPDMIKEHLCAHPLIPGYAHPSPAGIREWAVRQMYKFCVEHGLPETTMILESHWRRIKKDFAHHFHLLRVDLLMWILVIKLAPTYYRKLDLVFDSTGQYRELPTWRKSFKLQAVYPVPAVFFLQVKQERTSPFWKHPSLTFLSLARPNPLPAHEAPLDVDHLDAESDSDGGDELINVEDGTNDDATF
ncbi:hypothetical protein C0993_003278 [Termitomyces sp. T159_Od127]|nr:hypothetical protein C0993_003278 [Termitomyces sp. T159_Od127]